jgi:hypothetical protein
MTSPTTDGQGWRPISEAPLDNSVLIWWVPISPNKHAECWIIGQVSSHEPGKFWNPSAGIYDDLSRIKWWMPLPSPPTSGEGE